MNKPLWWVKKGPPRRVWRFLLLIALAPLLFGTGGCCIFGGRTRRRQASAQPQRLELSGANVYVAPIQSPVHSVAVMPFQAETELIGTSISDLFVTELLRARRYELVERGQLSQVLSEAEVALSGISESQAVALGNMLGADGVIIGTVDEYGAVARKGSTVAVVGLSVRLIDCASGRVMWSASFASMAEDHNVPISMHCRRVVRGTVTALAEEWPLQRQLPRKQAGEAALDAPVGLAGGGSRAVAPPPEKPPAVPDFSLSDFGLREVQLQWTPPDTPGVAYRIERASSPDGPFTEVAAVSAARGGYTDSGSRREPLEDAATYYYRLTGVSPAGLESESSPVRESMTAPPPDPPAGLQADTPAGRAASLRWTAGEGEEITGYIIERASPPKHNYQQVGETGEMLFSEGGTPDSPLKDSTVYRYRVRAINRVGALSEPSDSIAVTTLPPPEPVKALRALSAQPRRVPLAWRESPEIDVVRYEIERAESADGPFTPIGVADGRNSTGYEDRGDKTGRGRRSSLTPLRDNARYHYRVRAVNEVESASAWSDIAEAVTKPVPAAPQGVQAGEGSVGRIVVTWEPNPEEDIAAYSIAASSDAGGPFMELQRIEVSSGGASLSCTEESLPPGDVRYYRVRAVDRDGLYGEWSATVAGSTKPQPDAPRNPAFEWDAGEVRLSWDPPPQDDVIRYRVWQRRMLRSDAELQVVEETESVLSADTVGRRLQATITAVDTDGLESEPTEVLDIRPP